MMHPGTERPDQNRYYWIRFARDGIWAIGWWLDRFWRCPVTQERLGDVYEWADILTPEQEAVLCKEQYLSGLDAGIARGLRRAEWEETRHVSPSDVWGDEESPCKEDGACQELESDGAATGLTPPRQWTAIVRAEP